MAKCERIRLKKRRYCSGDLTKRIELQDRDWVPRNTGQTGEEEFTTDGKVWAGVTTLIGTTVFDGVNDKIASHDFIIRHRTGITAETWILWLSDRYDILRVEDVDGLHEFMRLRCNFRGPAVKEVNAS